MVAMIFFLLNLGASIFKPKSRLEAENAALRHVIVLQCKVRGRVQFTNSDRLFFIQLYRWCPSVLKAMVLVRPEHLCAGIVPPRSVSCADLCPEVPLTTTHHRLGSHVPYKRPH